MERDRDRGQGADQQPFQLDTKATCFICFKAVVEEGSGSSTNNGDCLKAPEEGVPSPATYSLRNICRHLKLDMEMIRLLINHDEDNEAQSRHDDPTPEKGIPPDLKVSLCQACGMVVTRFSELFRKQELIRMEMGSCLGVVGRLLGEADKDAPFIQQFHQRMTSDINPRSFLCLRVVEELRKEMVEKCMEVAKKYPAPVPTTEEIDRAAKEPHENSGSGNEARAPGRAPQGSGSLKKLQRKGPSPKPGSGRTIQACASIGTPACPHLPLPPNPAPRRSLLCNQCGATFKFPETLQAHLKIVHGLVLVQEEPSQPLVIPSSPKTVKYQFGKGGFESSQRLQRNVQRGAHGGFTSLVDTASISTTSVQAHNQLQQQPDLSGAEADDDFVEADITDIDDELTMTLVSPAPLDDDDDAQDNVSIFKADPAPWDTFSPGLLDTSDPSEESTSSSVVIPRPNSESSTGAEKDPVQEPWIPKGGPMPMPQLINIAPKLPEPGRGTRQLSTRTDAEYVFNRQTGRYDCPRCSKNFGTVCSCQRHFRTIHLAIRFACEHCGKTCSCSESRKYHQFRHLGIRVKCGLCDATFSNASSLSGHRHSVHFGKRYTCQYCSRSFARSGIRNAHQRRCKGKISPSHD